MSDTAALDAAGQPQQDATSADTAGQMHSVVIVGAGLGGSAAAAFLARAGIDTVVLERHDSPPERPRAWILSPRTLEILRQLGLAETIQDEGSREGWTMHTAGTLLDMPTEAGQDTDDAAGISPTGSAVCDQDIVEEHLRSYAVDHGADIRWGCEVAALTPLNDHIEVHTSHGAPLYARTVILAQGASIDLLEGLGIATDDRSGEGFDEFDQVLFRSRQLDEEMRSHPGRAFLCTDTGSIVFRRDRGRWQLQHQNELIDDIDTALTRAIGRPVDAEAIDHSSWRPTASLASAMRAGNVFLVGDAAHAMPPSLGMAGNLAIADAHNLAWKLAWVLCGDAGPGLLDSYEPERMPVDAIILDASVARTRGEDALDPLTAALGMTYPPATSPALIGEGEQPEIFDPHDDTFRVGARMPHRWLSENRSTLDLVDPTSIAVVAAQTAPPTTPAATHIPTADADTLWLVRPDGHLAAVTIPTDLQHTIGTVLDRAVPADQSIEKSA